MKKAIAAAAVGVLLVAGQAAAANNTAAVRVGDRVGAAAGESSEFAGVPLPVLIVGAGLLAAAVVVASDDDGDSD
jgi:hypothetical protein